jgi:hypothetical protein
LTGGHVLAGYHEVVVNKATRKVIEAKKAKGESLWRVSSTCFGHIASDQTLEPLAPFNTPEAMKKWPSVLAGHQVDAALLCVCVCVCVCVPIELYNVCQVTLFCFVFV